MLKIDRQKLDRVQYHIEEYLKYEKALGCCVKEQNEIDSNLKKIKKKLEELGIELED